MASIKDKKYIYIPKFFSKSELSILQKYCKKLVYKTISFDPQSPLTPSYYKDPLMDAFLITKKDKAEKISGLKLNETYAYWRYYIHGSTLKNHVDRPSCEISISACIKKYDDWPLTIEKETIELEEGDALLYAGCDQKHGRPGTYKGEGMAQVFFTLCQSKWTK
jgi:hypothetical protein